MWLITRNRDYGEQSTNRGKARADAGQKFEQRTTLSTSTAMIDCTSNPKSIHVTGAGK